MVLLTAAPFEPKTFDLIRMHYVKGKYAIRTRTKIIALYLKNIFPKFPSEIRKIEVITSPINTALEILGTLLKLSLTPTKI